MDKLEMIESVLSERLKVIRNGLIDPGCMAHEGDAQF